MSLPEVTFQPDGKKIQVRAGTTLLNAGRKARVNIRTRCDGKAACLMCKVHVEDQTALAPMKQNERLMLGEQAAQGYRLACQALIQSSLTVTVPEDPFKAAIRAQLAKQQEDEW
jgi:ferredoxin, 2Fe-2S